MTGESKPESTAGTESGVACENEEHPMDKHFGCIHAMALGLVHRGYAEDALALGQAHETLQGYVITIEQQRDDVVEFIRQIFGPKYDAEIAAILQARWLASAAGNKKEGV